MAKAILIRNGGDAGISSNELTAVAGYVLTGRTYVGKDSNDEIATGTMPDNSTLTSNGTVPGINSVYPNVPTRDGEFLQIQTDTSGNLRLNICPPQGYYPGGGASYVGRPAGELGWAQSHEVLPGATFTSANGIGITGTMPKPLNSSNITLTTADTRKVVIGKNDVDGAGGLWFVTNSDGTARICTALQTSGYYDAGSIVGATLSKSQMANYLGYSGITSFKVSSYTYNSITVSWAKPTTGGFSGLRLVLKAGSAPTSITDGTYVNSTGTSYTFSGLSLNTTYYITAYPYVTFTNYETKYYNQASITKSVNIGSMGKYGNASQMGYGRNYGAAATTGDVAIFAGGFYWNSSGYFYPNSIDLYNSSRTHSHIASMLNYGVWGPAGARAGNYAIIAGGWTGTQSNKDSKGGEGYNPRAYIFNSSGTKVSTPGFTARMWLDATTVNGVALFGGGYGNNGYESVVEGYNSSGTKISVNSLAAGKSELAAATAGSIAVFGGGRTAARTMSSTIDTYNSSGTRISNSSALSVARYELAAASAGNYAIFGGGRNSTASTTSYLNTVDVINSSGTRQTTSTLSAGRFRLCATNVGYYAIFAG